MNRVLITGITGQDGSYLTEQLLEKGCEVFGLKRRHSGINMQRIAHLTDKITLIDGDMTDIGSLTRALKIAEPDDIYNLASQSFVGTSWQQPYYTIQVTGVSVLNLLEAVIGIDIEPKILQASSSEMFGQASESPQNEETKFHPRSPYGVAKVMAYWTTVNYRESYGMQISNSICFNHESPRRGKEFVTKKIAKGLVDISEGRQRFLELGNIEAKRDWGYAPDFTEAMQLLLLENTSDDYVVATGEQHSVKDFILAGMKLLGLEPNIERYVKINPYFWRPADVESLVGDATKIREKVGWKPTVDFEGLVKLMIDYELGDK